MKLVTYIISAIVLLTAGALWYVTTQADNEPEVSQNQQKPVPQVSSPPQTEKFDTSRHSIDKPDSIWVVVNKQRPLHPPTYQPDDLVVPKVRLRVPGHETMQLRSEASEALEEMFQAAQADGISLMLSSAFRSYEYQENLYNSYVRSQGQATADSQSARPGHSEHQTGLAADLRPINGKCELEVCFGDMAEGKWVAENAYKFGFIIRYTQTNEPVAGYSYEPWHVRYVGVDLATELRNINASSLEDFFNLPPAPNYN